MPPIQPGFVFRVKALRAHPWVVLSAPTLDNPKFVAANWSTLDDTCIDDACILNRADHPLITRPSTMIFSRARLWDSDRLSSGIDQQALEVLPQVSAIVLKRIIDGARKSPELRQEWKDLLPQ